MYHQKQFQQWVRSRTNPEALWSALRHLDAGMSLDGQTPLEAQRIQERRMYIARKAPVLSARLIKELARQTDTLEALTTNAQLSSRQASDVWQQAQTFLETTLPSHREKAVPGDTSPPSLYMLLEDMGQVIQNLKALPGFTFQQEDIEFLMSWLQGHLRQTSDEASPSDLTRVRHVFDLGLPWLRQLAPSVEGGGPAPEAINELVDELRTSDMPVAHYSSEILLASYSGPDVWHHALDVALDPKQQAPKDWAQAFYHLSAQSRAYRHPKLLERLRQLKQPSIYRHMLDRLEDPAILGDVLEELTEVADSVAAEWVARASGKRLSRLPSRSFSRLLSSPRSSVRTRVLRRLRDLSRLPDSSGANQYSR